MSSRRTTNLWESWIGIASETLLTTEICVEVFDTTQPCFSIASAIANVLFSMGTSSKANVFAILQTLLQANINKVTNLNEW